MNSDNFQIKCLIRIAIMPDNKNHCKKCKERHAPPTGKRCRRLESLQEEGSEMGLLRDAADLQVADVNGGESLNGQQLQLQILNQLERVNKRLDTVEDKVAEATSGASTKSKLSRDFVTSSVKKCKKCKKYVESLTESSSDDSDTASLETLRSHKLQRQVDKRIRALERSSQSSGNEKIKKMKSKRGGNIDVVVKEKVSWPHEHILGGIQRQRISYDQLNLTQWIQGFCRNILEENSVERRDAMVSYMADLMEDATDFSWQGAKAAHTVMLCEMERGVLTWEDTECIDRIRRAHAQKHFSQSKPQNWAKTSENQKKPWFCKYYQQGICSQNKDHDVNG